MLKSVKCNDASLHRLGSDRRVYANQLREQVEGFPNPAGEQTQMPLPSVWEAAIRITCAWRCRSDGSVAASENQLKPWLISALLPSDARELSSADTLLSGNPNKIQITKKPVSP